MANMRVVLTWAGNQNPRPMATVFDIDNQSGSFAPAEDLVATLMATGSILSRMSAAIQLVGCRMYTPTFEDSWSGSEAGALGGALSPPNVTFLIRKVGGLRRFNGRIFLPGVRESDVNEGGLVDSTHAGQLQTAANVWLTALSNANFAMYQTRSDRNPEPVEVASLQVDPKVATQRRRLGR